MNLLKANLARQTLTSRLLTLSIYVSGLMMMPLSAQVSQSSESINKVIEANKSSPSHWFSYQVDMEPNNGMPCCFLNDDKTGCFLTKRQNHWGTSGPPVKSDSTQLDIYFQTKSGEVSDIFIAGSECPVDKSGTDLTQLQDVSEKQSLKFLKSLISVSDKNRSHRLEKISSQATAGLALHRGDAAHQVLVELVESSNLKTSHNAVFWIGESRNEAGYKTLSEIVENKSQPIRLRKQAVFGLAVNKTLESDVKLLALAKGSNHETVTAEALFWIAERKVEGAYQVILNALEQSSSNKLQDKAVFALSLIGTDESWRGLQKLAVNHHSIDVQKKAVFWLSQNKDKEVIDFLIGIAQGRSAKPVREHAVFAISQLPDQSAANGLIQLIKTSNERFIKQKSIFWLGQLDEPKATEFVESLLLASSQ